MGLQGFRDTKSSALIYIIFAVIIVVFVFMFGLPSTDLMSGGNSKRVAKVGDHTISSELMRSMILRNYDDNIFSNPQFDQYELDMADKLATVFILADDARQAGLRVSEEEWNDYIMNWESRNEDIFRLGFYRKNQFSKNAYEQGLYRINMSSRDYRAYKENEILARKYLQILENSLAVSDETLWQLYSMASDSATIDAVRITPADVQKTLKPLNDTDIQKYLADNDASLKSWYDAHVINFTTPEKVNLQQITIQKSFAKLDNVGAKTQKNLNHNQRFEVARRQLVEEGLDFNQGFADYDESVAKNNHGIQGLTALENFSDEYQKALEGKKVGDVFTIELKNAYLIVKVLERTEKVVAPYESVKLDIAKTQLSDARVKARMDEVSSNMTALLKAGKSIENALNDSLYSGILLEAPAAPEPVAAEPAAAPVADAAEPAAASVADAAEPAAAPVPADVIVIPDFDRVKLNSYTFLANTDSITGLGTSDALIRDVSNAEVGQTLANAYTVDDTLVFARVTEKKLADRAMFDSVKEQLRSQAIKLKMVDLIGVPDDIVNLRGTPGRWLEQKLASAKLSKRVEINDEFFAAERSRLAKREAQRNSPQPE